ncbi:sodium/proton antiporter, CPA1 family [Halpernia humi]|uniref:Sodium/proton antiporter, CPA1 family n=1 Tax=Halpernia humi TaxID=493375 RepID=A0A1H6A0N2_9FLAO|nr:cation:proton antiporter [Halpernia humi]SEG42313.1 sodium/proton antiporter, CPA1 family [Halpernia humi]
MAETVIISICVLLLISYFFDITTKFTKIPSVILLLAIGWVINQISGLSGFVIPDLNVILPILGTLGLILIVLEGSLELELNHSKKSLVARTLLISTSSVLIMSALSTAWLYYEWDIPIREGLINVIPFCIISSSIAIPSAVNLSGAKREFIIYESSLSDIVGVIFFNFATFGTAITLSGGFHFIGQFLLMIVISIVASLILAILLGKIDHHIKYGPIIISIILIYEISKIYHLPALIFILFFGLVLGNIDELRGVKFLKNVRFTRLTREVSLFKDVVIEATFVVRSLFFLVLGFVLETDDIINVSSLEWSVSIVVLIFVVRFFLLKITKMEVQPLVFIAPRGLITILLFLAIIPADKIPFLNQSIIIQVILMTTIIMMIGVMLSNKKDEKEKLVDSVEEVTV